jgi:N6-L-threonylcarbamoyladenine synthase
MIILGIETSCDETAASIVRGDGDKVEVLSNVVSSQIEIHKKYGGVVPEAAAREHVKDILPVIRESIINYQLSINNSKLKNNLKFSLDAIAVTIGPGLVTSLLVGVETARTLAYAWNVPLIGVNHIEGHIYANFINSDRHSPEHRDYAGTVSPKFPALVLTVSGGHTILVLMEAHGKFKIIGETRDDAAGEAFDKAAKMLGLGYPGGPAIAEGAGQLKINNEKLIMKESKISLPRPMINSGNFDFSFSGLKTALLYKLNKDKTWKKNIPAYCAEFEDAVVDVLVSKTIKAAKKFQVKSIMLSGGVAANKKLRATFQAAVEKNFPEVFFSMPDLKYCTDNAAMIATAGYFRAQRKDFMPWQKLDTDSNAGL